MSKSTINKMILDAANAVSENAASANEYLKSQGVDIDVYVKRGLDNLYSSDSKAKKSLTKSQSFFRRAVLAARIAHEYHAERTFGIVKFQKLLYLCEHASNMMFTTKYTKQAAGPMDNRFIHGIKAEFERQGWFKVQKVKEGKITKVVFIPLEGVNEYKSYYDRHYKDVNEEIVHLLNIFRKWRTSDIELVATIYSCVNEIQDEGDEITNELVLKKVYEWHKEKEKFIEGQIIKFHNWMLENKIYPASH